MIPAGKDDKESQKKEAGHLRDTFLAWPASQSKGCNPEFITEGFSLISPSNGEGSCSLKSEK